MTPIGSDPSPVAGISPPPPWTLTLPVFLKRTETTHALNLSQELLVGTPPLPFDRPKPGLYDIQPSLQVRTAYEKARQNLRRNRIGAFTKHRAPPFRMGVWGELSEAFALLS